MVLLLLVEPSNFFAMCEVPPEMILGKIVITDSLLMTNKNCQLKLTQNKYKCNVTTK